MANIKKIALNGTSYDVVDATAVHTVDSALSSSSTNPVQNKVVYSALKNQPHFEYVMTSGYLQPTNFSGTFPTTFSALVSHADFEIALRNPVIVHYLSLTGSDDFVAQGLLWFGVNTQITDEWTILFSDGVTFQGALTNGVTGTMSYDSSEQVWYLGDATAHTPGYKSYTDDAIDGLDATISGLGVGKTITALSETNGVISAAASNIAIAGSQVTSGTIAEARLPSTVVKRSDELQTTNPFAPDSMKGPYISKIDNAFYAASKRWTITSTPTGSIDPLFDGSYETFRSIASGTSCTFNMKFDTESNGYFPGYPYGYILVSFYDVNIPASVTGRAYCNYEAHGIGWHDINFSIASGSTARRVTYRGRQAKYNISEIEITVTADASMGAKVAQIEMHLDRPNSAKNPFLSKYAAETLYYGLTAPSFTGKLRGELNYGTCATAAATADKVVDCPGFVLENGARLTVRFNNGNTSAGPLQLNVNSTGLKRAYRYTTGGSVQSLDCRCEAGEYFEFVYNGNNGYWVLLTPYGVRDAATSGSRFTSCNRSYPHWGLEYFNATSSMTTGKPPTDGHVLGMHWDNGSLWASQLCVGNGSARLFTRGQNNGTWGNWREAPLLASTPTNGQVIVSDETTQTGQVKGVTLNVDGANFDGTNPVKHYGITTLYSNGVFSIIDANYNNTLVQGFRMTINVAYDMSYDTGLKMNIRTSGTDVPGSGDKFIKRNGEIITSLTAGEVLEFVYDGTDWQQVGGSGGDADVPLPESGTCTLTDGMSISFTANYYKIGRQVTVWGTIPKYASTALGLTELPYTASASMTSVVQFQNPASNAAMVSATLSVAAGYATLGTIGYITGSSNNGMFQSNSTGSWLNLIPSTGLPFNFTYITDTP